MNKIYTIGYEGSDIDRFMKTLEIMKIELLADVRQLPISRKKGFAKNGLANRLSESGIGYQHFKALGDPKEGREAARAGNYERFEEIFLDHFRGSSAQESLVSLLSLAKEKRTALLCFERCADKCHRKYIAAEAILEGFEVYNVVADQPERYLQNELNIPSYNPSQSLTAAE